MSVERRETEGWPAFPSLSNTPLYRKWDLHFFFFTAYLRTRGCRWRILDEVSREGGPIHIILIFHRDPPAPVHGDFNMVKSSGTAPLPASASVSHVGACCFRSVLPRKYLILMCLGLLFFLEISQ